jgi:hypothetical protein
MQSYKTSPSRNVSMKGGTGGKVLVPGCGMERSSSTSTPGSKAKPVAGFSKKSGQISGKV